MAEAQQSAPQGPVFTIDKIYVKDLSLENPGAPKSFLTQEAPQVEVGLRTRGEQVEPDIYECVLTVTLTAKTGDKTLFLVEAAQAGVFTIRGVPPEHMQQVIAINCPTVLFPYGREALHARAPGLPDTGGSYAEFADDTDHALASGCEGAALALVERSLDRAQRLLGAAPALWLHGGGADALRERLPPHLWVPDVVLRGLARWQAHAFAAAPPRPAPAGGPLTLHA